MALNGQTALIFRKNIEMGTFSYGLRSTHVRRISASEFHAWNNMKMQNSESYLIEFSFIIETIKNSDRSSKKL